MRLRRFVITTAVAAFGVAGISAPVVVSVTGSAPAAASHANPLTYYRA